MKLTVKPHNAFKYKFEQGRQFDYFGATITNEIEKDQYQSLYLNQFLYEIPYINYL